MKVGKYYQAFLALVCSFVLIFSVFPAKSQSQLEFPGSETLPECYLSDLEYKDHTIHVKITAHRAFETDYWVASISIAQPDQLRTASAAGFESQRTMKGKVLAQRVHAAFATNGDYFSYIPDGYLIRQGVLYRNLPSGKRDVLLIDDKGDFHIELQAGDGIHEAYQDKGIVNSFNFGPALVVDGTRVTEYRDQNNAALKGRQRMSIAQVKRGSLEYIAVACAGPKGRNKGMTLDEFSQIIALQGVENAYNLDGGYSTMMIFKNEYINSDYERTMRRISDIIYFVSLHETIPRAD